MDIVVSLMIAVVFFLLIGVYKGNKRLLTLYKENISEKEIEVEEGTKIIRISENKVLLIHQVEGKENTFSFTVATIRGDNFIYGSSYEAVIEPVGEMKVKFLSKNTFQITHPVEGKPGIVSVTRATITGDIITYDETREIDKEEIDEARNSI